MGLAEIFGSAFVQEAVSRVVSSVLGKRKERALEAQGHNGNMDRLGRAILEMETALEVSANRPITNLSLLQTRHKIRCAYLQAVERQQDEQKLLKADDVRTFERVADWAHKFMGDLESSCSLSRNNLCPNYIISRHLFQGTSLRCVLVQGNLRRRISILPLCSDEERGLEVELSYSYCDDDSTPMGGKTFSLLLVLRLSESVDIVGAAIKGLQYLTSSQSKLVAAESAVGELTLLPTLLQGVAPSRVPWEDHENTKPLGSAIAQIFREDPACCKASRLGLRSNNNNVSSELSHIFPEEVIFFAFYCNISAVVEPPSTRSRRSSAAFEAGSSSMVGVLVVFMPHDEPWETLLHGSRAVVEAGGVETERRDGTSLQQVSETLKSDAVNCFLRQPEATDYWITWSSGGHGTAWFVVNKPRIQPTRRTNKYNTRARSTKPSARR